MAIIDPVLPADVHTAFARDIGKFCDSGDPFVRMLTGVMPAQHHRHPVTTLYLEDIVNRREFDTKEIGWRFLAGRSRDLAAAAEITKQDHGWTVTSVSNGPAVYDALQASVDLEAKFAAQLRGKPADYEMWLLRVPGLGIEGFCLKSQTAEPLLYIIRARDKSLPKQTLSPLSTCLEILAKQAVKRLAYKAGDDV